MFKQPIPYKKLILVCTNKRENSSKPCCGLKKGEELCEKMKQFVRERNLKDVIRVSRTGCLGKCEYGPNVMIYPEGIWYSHVSEADIPFLIEEVLKSLPS